MSSFGMRHPTDEQLLYFVDGELAVRAGENVRGHLQACWECRQELEEIEHTIRECVRYRRVVLDACVPSPPQPWFDIYPRLARIDEMQARRHFAARVWEWLATVWHRPRQWVPAIIALVLIALLVQQLRQAPAVQAAELLRKAVAAADSRPLGTRRIRIRTRTQHLTRIVGPRVPAARTSSESESSTRLETLFRAANYSWDDPLSAKAFASWRDQLAIKHDEITVAPDHYRLHTVTDSGELVEATLKLNAADLRAVEGTLQFRNHELVEISELSEVLPSADLPVPRGLPSADPALSSQDAVRAGSPVVQATPGDELAVLAVLHNLGADLGDPIEVIRAGGEVLVSGIGIGDARQEQIRQQLRAMTRVTVHFSADPPAQAADDRTPSRISVGPGTGPLQAEMERRLGGRALFEQFADQVFDTTDRFMSRAHALRRIEQHFPVAIEEQMTAEDRTLLARIREDHIEKFLENVAITERQIGSVLDTTPQGVPSLSAAGSWQGQTEPLFIAARNTESLLAALLGSSTDQVAADLPAKTVSSLAQLRVCAENYRRISASQ